MVSPSLHIKPSLRVRTTLNENLDLFFESEQIIKDLELIAMGYDFLDQDFPEHFSKEDRYHYVIHGTSPDDPEPSKHLVYPFKVPEPLQHYKDAQHRYLSALSDLKKASKTVKRCSSTFPFERVRYRAFQQKIHQYAALRSDPPADSEQVTSASPLIGFKIHQNDPIPSFLINNLVSLVPHKECPYHLINEMLDISPTIRTPAQIRPRNLVFICAFDENEEAKEASIEYEKYVA